MEFKKLNRKGVAGTEVVIQLMIAVFVIGLLAMLIAVTGASLYESVEQSSNDTVALTLINDTIFAVADVPDNFSLWLVVGGLVVVIGLIAFVIVTLRGTGMMGEQQ